MKCKVCDKVFAPAPFHAYRIRTCDGHDRLVCSWHCQRTHEKEREEKKQRKEKMQQQQQVWSFCEKCGRKIFVGEILFEIGDDDYCSDCCKQVNTEKEMLEQWMI